MKELVILSGKGGTGKTTVAAALAHLMSQDRRLVLVDADVDAPNLGMILRPEAPSETPFIGGKRASIDAARCTACGRCAQVCRYDAIEAWNGAYRVDDLSCEGCGACATQCPAQAIAMVERLSGYWSTSETRFGPFVHARLVPGQENSGKLVSRVRAEALAIANDRNADRVVIDGSPGTGCPVMAAVTGVDLALMVSEPTVSGIHDLERALAVAQHFRVATAVCVNKSDINPGMTQRIVAHCEKKGIPVLAQLPYDEIALAAMRQARAVTELRPSAMGDALRALGEGLERLL